MIEQNNVRKKGEYKMKRLVAKILVKPNESKNEDFTLALVDYFNAEFKKNNMKSKKNNGYVKVALNGKYEDKYDSVVIDCCNGKVYLRGKDIKDKYFGRLSKFNMKRKSDAYHCVNYNATRIINRINKINASFGAKVVVADLRQKNVVALYQKDIEKMICIAKRKKSFIKEFSFDKDFTDKICEIFKQYYEKFINSEQYTNYVKSNASRIEDLDLMQIMEDNHLDKMVIREVKQSIGVCEFEVVDLNDDIQGAFWGFCNDNEELVNKCKEKAYDLLALQTKVSNKKHILDMRPIIVADLRIVADEQKDFATEMANDKSFHDKVNSIFEKICTDFINSDDCEKYIKGYKPSEIMYVDSTMLMEENKIDEKAVIQVEKELNTREYDVDLLESEIHSAFYSFVAKNEQVWNAFQKKVTEVSTKNVKSLSEELSNLNDVPGRQIPVKDIDNIDVINRDKPFLYYDGDIMIGEQGGTHSQIVTDLLGREEDRWKGGRPNTSKIQEIDQNAPIGFGHIVDNIAFVDDWGMKNCTVQEIGKAIVKENGIDKAYTSPDTNQNYFERVAKNKYKQFLDLRW